MHPDWLYVHTETADALADGHPVVAMESTLISHGLPWPANLETAKQAEAAVREAGAIPATVAVVRGRPTLGLNASELEEFARASGVFKASRRDLGAAVGLGRTAATTVSATMVLAVRAADAAGGEHRQQPSQPLDISADLMELSRTPVLVICAGAKSILDLPQTLELLESFGVPVLGYRTNEFPAFCVRGSGGPVSARVESPAEAARVYDAHVRMGGRGAILVQPVDENLAVSAEVFESSMQKAEAEAATKGISGAEVTPFLLARLAELTDGKTLAANKALIVSNARLGAEVAVEMTRAAAG